MQWLWPIASIQIQQMTGPLCNRIEIVTKSNVVDFFSFSLALECKHQWQHSTARWCTCARCRHDFRIQRWHRGRSGRSGNFCPGHTTNMALHVVPPVRFRTIECEWRSGHKALLVDIQLINWCPEHWLASNVLISKQSKRSCAWTFAAFCLQSVELNHDFFLWILGCVLHSSDFSSENI